MSSPDPTTDHNTIDRKGKTMQHHFETTGPITLKVEIPAGDVTLRATEALTTSVRLVPRGRGGADLAERFTVEAHGNEVVVIAPKREGFLGFGSKGSVDVEIDLPVGSAVDARTGSGHVRATGLLDDVRASTGSGKLSFHELGDAELRSGSGDVTVRAVRGGLSAKTGSGDLVFGSLGGRSDLVSGSGDIEIRRAEAPVKAKTGSGDVRIEASAADIEVMTGSGDVRLAGVHGGEVRARTGTGDVTIGVAAGVAAYLDLDSVAGDVDVDLEETSGPGDAEATTSLFVHAGIGDIHVKRAEVSLA
ncbi:hypothetical protein N865_13715 [Intrasporangium oryzae NRRL B-24470]|uniref:DUF4097 domain-containing protein n=1 Tax=Intrasporangium oryzae NRRL B-24470 TaxID=1386089 RepID=W9G457_9MICO|nr:DUF4097 family beta strand repeat-containing protein [Intrasporangium oryzae]EWT00805.1 hypothetical protein N865_13715 [Intrasporangium oryzae NRRL B-24470]